MPKVTFKNVETLTSETLATGHVQATNDTRQAYSIFAVGEEVYQKIYPSWSVGGSLHRVRDNEGEFMTTTAYKEAIEDSNRIHPED